MKQSIAPIAVRPWTLNGLSERLLVSHYEHHYGSAVRTVNAVRSELATLDAGVPDYRLAALKREELAAMGSVALHELYFGNLGGKGTRSRTRSRPPSRRTSGVSGPGAASSCVWDNPSLMDPAGLR
jgi:hypothetical protein